ncbi:MAG: hypothetical protein UT30_C0007G0014 [Candidatus Uhrbacteria bacterium GW2011_GWF2_39_13]|uniref:Plasmid stabilization system n=1 Tax=Candidatus Uhrbacteria bacterium GW2011_GWF2_39_13 TaxID=1618995 RepID=A0A0G0MMX2_9BACT|nr:MAG: hypothetical protein UT30_C0007G0014 [Candidatus Uhrbacteria bacterium GW2011_GWF2_39_13]HAU65733.1 hypothetical protein [Candidatus Uhrbacteria bacterium]
MFKIYYREAVISAITSFIRAYEEAFFELYRDSGLVTEQQIIENYRRSAQKLNEQIFSEIENYLSVRHVLGRKEHRQWHEFTFYVGSRLVTVYYTTEDAEALRIVEMIGIERKPIIF